MVVSLHFLMIASGSGYWVIYQRWRQHCNRRNFYQSWRFFSLASSHQAFWPHLGERSWGILSAVNCCFLKLLDFRCFENFVGSEVSHCCFELIKARFKSVTHSYFECFRVTAFDWRFGPTSVCSILVGLSWQHLTDIWCLTVFIHWWHCFVESYFAWVVKELLLYFVAASEPGLYMMFAHYV